MQRKIRTDKDKKLYEKKVSGKRNVFEIISGIGHKKKLIVSILVGILITAGIGFIVYENVRPIRFKDVIGGNYVKVEWSNNSVISAEELKEWSMERVYPGSLGENESIQLCFYDEEGLLVGNVTFLGHDNLFIYEGEVYKYIEPEKKESE